ncbi:hypothetical protein H7F33_13160 [Pedobacter sp. PAMC26386]|nr:hypothetical protein H7F33_13160 [Pedobacter sp. PAMC26386]
MDRREIFNILFKGSLVNEPIVPEPDPVLETPAHLKTDQTVQVFKEWTDLTETGIFKLDLSTEFAFTVTLDLSCPLTASGNERPVNLIIGLKPDHAASVKIGLNEQGCLFMDQLMDERTIAKDKLLTGVQLVLTVNPLGMGMSFAKLKIMDSAGLTLSSIKSMQYTTADWVGEMALTNPAFNSLRIEGLHTTEI